MTKSDCLDSYLQTLDSLQAEALDKYCAMLLKWNRVMNLTGSKTREQLGRNLLADSFELAAFLTRLFPSADAGFSIWDLGAGAGLPGIPLRIVWRRGNYTLVESRQKRAIFLQNVLAVLKLPATYVFAGRAEDFFKTVNSMASCILSRAFMPWEKLPDFCGPHLLPNGILIVLASGDIPLLPAGWTAIDRHAYRVGSRERWFWALARKGQD